MTQEEPSPEAATPYPSPRRRSGAEALAFVVLALGFSLAYGLLVAASRRGLLPFAMPGSGVGTVLKAVLRDFGPALAAVLAGALLGGRRSLRELWAISTRWRAPAWLWVLALCGAFAAMLPVILIGLSTGTLERSTAALSPLRFLVVFLAMAVVDGPLGEEIGWRGFLLPRLVDRWGAIAASLAIGAVWWLWHVPLYIADGREMGAWAWVEYLATTTALSLVFTWFFLHAGRSALLTILLHDTANFSIYLLLRNVYHRVGDAATPKLAYDAVVIAAGLAAAWALRHRHAAGRVA